MARWRRGLQGAAVVTVAAVAVFAVLPSRAHVERSQRIAAPAATVYELLDDPAAVRRWSPWRDLRTRYLFSGPPVGVGARMDWTGVRPGSEVVETAQPYARIVYRMTLADGVGASDYRLSPAPGGVRVTWRLERRSGWSPADRWSLFLFRSQTGPEMDRGLDRLAEVAEALPQADLASTHIRLAERPGGRAVEGVAAPGDAAATLTAIRLFMGVHRLAPDGPPRVEADPRRPDLPALIVAAVRSGRSPAPGGNP